MCLAWFNMDIPQGQEMGPEVKSRSLVAGRGHLLSCGKGSSSREARFCCSARSIFLVWGDFLDPFWVIGIYTIKYACEPNRLMERFPIHTKIKALPSPTPVSSRKKGTMIKLTWHGFHGRDVLPVMIQNRGKTNSIKHQVFCLFS